MYLFLNVVSLLLRVACYAFSLKNINRVLFFIKLLCETTGICLALYFQIISNLAEALYLICMFIIWQQIVQPNPSIALDGVATRPLVYKGTAICMDRISMFQDAVTLLMAAYFVYEIYYPHK